MLGFLHVFFKKKQVKGGGSDRHVMMMIEETCKKKKGICVYQRLRTIGQPNVRFGYLIFWLKKKREGPTTENKQGKENENSVLRYPTYEGSISGIADGSGTSTYRWRRAECWPKGPRELPERREHQIGDVRILPNGESE